MIEDPTQLFLEAARRNLAIDAKEAVVRYTFEQFLPQIFPDRPWWVRQHAGGAEALTHFVKNDGVTHGFIDTLVGGTPIEYEPNLARSGVEDHAKGQIRDYAAGELNKGLPADTLIGVISDTLRWQAFTIDVAELATPRPYGRHDITLTRIDAIDLSAAHEHDGRALKRFLQSHLGREAARPLYGETLAADLGLESEIGSRLRLALDGVYKAAATARPGYAELIERLWTELVDAIGDGSQRNLGREEYLDEFYLITLAKMICANVLDRSAPRRSAVELIDVLSGAFFTRRGLRNYVEYDLFGWLNEEAATSGMLAIAEEIQDDLVAYNFASPAQEDLFGRLLANLGRRSTRLILGQELTPPWLARLVVQHVARSVDHEPLRLLDSACGSGAILVEAIRVEKEREVTGETNAQRASRLAASATGFDIDPLAALFAKTNWVVALRDELSLLPDVTIPVFNTDALFSGRAESGSAYVLDLDGEAIRPPMGLMAPASRAVFDDVLSSTYGFAMDEARHGSPAPGAAEAAADRALALGGVDIDRDELIGFVSALIRQLAELERKGRNGLWAYIIRNTSRPLQSSGEFNALAINPPWLALSKIGDNPYATQLNRLAEQLGVRPTGSSFLHTELAVVFLLESVRRYMAPGAPVAAILPSTIAQGAHQNRFRRGDYTAGDLPVAFDVQSIWELEKGIFKNEAVVLIGVHSPRICKAELPAKRIGEAHASDGMMTVITVGDGDTPDRVVWSTSGRSRVGFGYEPAKFRQGADLMPRTTWFHEFDDHGPDRVSARAIESGPRRYLVGDAKKSKDFKLPAGVVLERKFVARAALSNHLTPFHLAAPAEMLLPAKFERDMWRQIPATEFVLSSEGSRQAFGAIAAELGKPRDALFSIVDLMGKLRNQAWSNDAWIVVSGAGGANPCAAWTAPGVLKAGEVVFDQTLYWACVESEAEANYLVGAVNSPICAELIAPFQPKGEQGKRHIHKLPFGVTPPFDPADERHLALAEASATLRNALLGLAQNDAKLAEARRPDQSTLAARRLLISRRLREMPLYEAYAQAALAVYAAG